MNKKLLIGALVIVVLFGGAWAAMNFLPEVGPAAPDSSSQSSQPEETDKIEAPDFEMTDLEGNVVKLSDFRGKPVLLNFWASWCNPCKIEMPHFQSAFEAYGEDVAFIMLNLEDMEATLKFIEETGFSFPIFVDHGQQAAAAYGVASIPRTYTIDAEGYVVNGAIGSIDEARIASFITELIGEN